MGMRFEVSAGTPIQEPGWEAEAWASWAPATKNRQAIPERWFAAHRLSSGPFSLLQNHLRAIYGFSNRLPDVSNLHYHGGSSRPALCSLHCIPAGPEGDVATYCRFGSVHALAIALQEIFTPRNDEGWFAFAAINVLGTLDKKLLARHSLGISPKAMWSRTISLVPEKVAAGVTASTNTTASASPMSLSTGRRAPGNGSVC